MCETNPGFSENCQFTCYGCAPPPTPFIAFDNPTVAPTLRECGGRSSEYENTLDQTFCSTGLAVGLCESHHLFRENCLNTCAGCTESPAASVPTTSPTPTPTLFPTDMPTFTTVCPCPELTTTVAPCTIDPATCNGCEGYGATLDSLEFTYTSEFRVANGQGTKSAVVGTSSASSAYIVISDGDNNIIADTGEYALVDGDTFKLQASDFDGYRLPASIKLTIYDGSIAEEDRKEYGGEDTTLECDGLSCTLVHTSCSVPLQLGDAFGHVLVSAFTNTNGLVSSECPCHAPSEEPDSCNACYTRSGRKTGMSVLHFVYTGGATSSQHAQGDKLTVVGSVSELARLETVAISVLSSGVFVEEHTAVVVNATVVSLRASQFHGGRFPAFTTLVIYDPSTSTSEDRKGAMGGEYSACTGIVCITVHTSCSVPIQYGDVYGAIRVEGYTTLANENQYACQSGSGPEFGPLILVDARADVDVGLLENSDSVSYLDVGTHKLSIRLVAPILFDGSVLFNLINTATGEIVIHQMENNAPWSLLGDVVRSSGELNYYLWNSEPGTYLLTVTAYSGKAFAGSVLWSQATDFETTYNRNPLSATTERPSVCQCATYSPTPSPTTPAPTSCVLACDACEGYRARLERLEFTYTSEFQLANGQGTKSAVVGTSNADLVEIVVSDRNGNYIFTTNDLRHGDSFALNRWIFDDNSMPSYLKLTIYDASITEEDRKKYGAEDTTLECDGLSCALVHTSCSAPLQLGDAFGHVFVSAFTNTNGLSSSQCQCSGAYGAYRDTGASELCDACVGPTGSKTRLNSLRLEYTGGAALSKHAQGDNLSVIGNNSALADLDVVDILVVASGSAIAGYSSVVINETIVSLQASQFPDGRFPAHMTIVIYDPDSDSRKFGAEADSACPGVVCISFDSSCSVPVHHGDIYGPLLLAGFSNTDGGSEQECQSSGQARLASDNATAPTAARDADRHAASCHHSRWGGAALRLVSDGAAFRTSVTVAKAAYPVGALVYPRGDAFPDCPRLDASVLRSRMTTQCGLATNGQSYNCDRYNLTAACNGAAAVPGSQSMHEVCANLCATVLACGSYMLDQSIDIHSGLCILMEVTANPILLESCYMTSGSPSHISSTSQCNALLTGDVPRAPCAVCDHELPLIPDVVHLQWTSYAAASTVIFSSNLGLFTPGRDGEIPHGGVLQVVALPPADLAGSFRISTTSGTATLVIDCSQGMFIGEVLEFPDGYLTFVDFANSLGNATSLCSADILTDAKTEAVQPMGCDPLSSGVGSDSTAPGQETNSVTSGMISGIAAVFFVIGVMSLIVVRHRRNQLPADVDSGGDGKPRQDWNMSFSPAGSAGRLEMAWDIEPEPLFVLAAGSEVGDRPTLPRKPAAMVTWTLSDNLDSESSSDVGGGLDSRHQSSASSELSSAASGTSSDRPNDVGNPEHLQTMLMLRASEWKEAAPGDIAMVDYDIDLMSEAGFEEQSFAGDYCDTSDGFDEDAGTATVKQSAASEHPYIDVQPSNSGQEDTQL